MGILKKDNQLLIAERPPGKPYCGYWEFPGGKIEPNESSRSALNRELREELGIDVVNAKHFFSHQHQYPDKKVHLDIWLVTAFNGQPVSKEKQTLQWATLAEISERRILAGNHAVIEKLKLWLGENS